MADSSVPESISAQTYEVVITLLDVGVDVDRRVLAPDSASLADLHLIIPGRYGLGKLPSACIYRSQWNGLQRYQLGRTGRGR